MIKFFKHGGVFINVTFGEPKTVDEMDKIARQVVKDKLDVLLKEGEITNADEY